jgi:hypothetical protein
LPTDDEWIEIKPQPTDEKTVMSLNLQSASPQINVSPEERIPSQISNEEPDVIPIKSQGSSCNSINHLKPKKALPVSSPAFLSPHKPQKSSLMKLSPRLQATLQAEKTEATEARWSVATRKFAEMKRKFQQLRVAREEWERNDFYWKKKSPHKNVKARLLHKNCGEGEKEKRVKREPVIVEMVENSVEISEVRTEWQVLPAQEMMVENSEENSEEIQDIFEEIPATPLGNDTVFTQEISQNFQDHLREKSKEISDSFHVPVSPEITSTEKNQKLQLEEKVSESSISSGEDSTEITTEISKKDPHQKIVSLLDEETGQYENYILYKDEDCFTFDNEAVYKA